MQFIKFTKWVLYSMNFVFLTTIVILINDVNGGSAASKRFEDDHLLYLYFASIVAFLGLQINSIGFILIFIGLNIYGLYSSTQILNFYYYAEVDMFEKEDMWVMVSHYISNENGTLSTHMHNYQEKLRCCGLNNPNDYNGRVIPYSCCINKKVGQLCSYELAYKRGCWFAFANKFAFYRNFNLVLESIVIGAQIVSIVFSLIFVSELYKRKYSVNALQQANLTTQVAQADI